MVKPPNVQDIVKRLVRVAEGRVLTAAKPWNYGWSQPAYRHSADAAIRQNDTQSVALRPTDIVLFEEAVQEILQVRQIDRVYDSNELWGLIASLIGSLPLDATSEYLKNEIGKRLRQILDPPSSLVIFPVANVAAPKSLIELGPILVGELNSRFEQRLAEKTDRAKLSTVPVDAWWTSAVSGSPIVFACVGKGQLNRAIEDAEGMFDDLMSIALMLQPDLDALSLYSLRGDAYRPGIRGLAVDRIFLAEVAKTYSRVASELVTPFYVDGVFLPSISLHGYGETAFPLESLLPEDNKRKAQGILLGSGPIYQRLRVAARWHAKAHWAFDTTDAVLALGISFDALLSEKGPTPGRAIAERFALLDPDPEVRHRRYRQFQAEYYPARSSVAHGAKKSAIDAQFVRGMAKECRWVFSRILELTLTRSIATEDEYQQAFEGLRWGAIR